MTIYEIATNELLYIDHESEIEAIERIVRMPDLNMREQSQYHLIIADNKGVLGVAVWFE